jgi:CheY-like chemotaxis protein
MAQAANSALFSARLRFVEGLPARAEELSTTADRLARDPGDLEAAGMLRRRLHALLASAQVFEERALSLAVQDLIARLDIAQRAERAFTREEIDAVGLVVASLPTYVRPSLQPPAAYSDVRELLADGRHVVHPSRRPAADGGRVAEPIARQSPGVAEEVFPSPSLTRDDSDGGEDYVPSALADSEPPGVGDLVETGALAESGTRPAVAVPAPDVPAAEATVAARSPHAAANVAGVFASVAAPEDAAPRALPPGARRIIALAQLQPGTSSSGVYNAANAFGNPDARESEPDPEPEVNSELAGWQALADEDAPAEPSDFDADSDTTPHTFQDWSDVPSAGEHSATLDSPASNSAVAVTEARVSAETPAFGRAPAEIDPPTLRGAAWSDFESASRGTAHDAHGAHDVQGSIDSTDTRGAPAARDSNFELGIHVLSQLQGAETASGRDSVAESGAAEIFSQSAGELRTSDDHGEVTDTLRSALSEGAQFDRALGAAVADVPTIIPGAPDSSVGPDPLDVDTRDAVDTNLDGASASGADPEATSDPEPEPVAPNLILPAPAGVESEPSASADRLELQAGIEAEALSDVIAALGGQGEPQPVAEPIESWSLAVTQVGEALAAWRESLRPAMPEIEIEDLAPGPAPEVVRDDVPPSSSTTHTAAVDAAGETALANAADDTALTDEDPITVDMRPPALAVAAIRELRERRASSAAQSLERVASDEAQSLNSTHVREKAQAPAAQDESAAAADSAKSESSTATTQLAGRDLRIGESGIYAAPAAALNAAREAAAAAAAATALDSSASEGEAKSVTNTAAADAAATDATSDRIAIPAPAPPKADAPADTNASAPSAIAEDAAAAPSPAAASGSEEVAFESIEPTSQVQPVLSGPPVADAPADAPATSASDSRSIEESTTAAVAASEPTEEAPSTPQPSAEPSTSLSGDRETRTSMMPWVDAAAEDLDVHTRITLTEAPTDFVRSRQPPTPIPYSEPEVIARQPSFNAARSPLSAAGSVARAIATDGFGNFVESDPNEQTSPGFGPPVLLKQTVSGLLPTPKPALLLLVADAACAARVRARLAVDRFSVLHVASGDEAVRRLHETRPDLVFVSAEQASLPEADLVRRLKTDPLAPVSRVYVLLPEGATCDETFLAQVGADGAITEPIAAETLPPLVADPSQPLRLSSTDDSAGRESTIDDIAAQIAEEIRRGIAESLRTGNHERGQVGDGSQLMAAAWSALGRVRSHLADQSRGKIRVKDEESSSSSLLPAASGTEASSTPSIHPSQLLAGCRVLVADDDPAVLWFFVGLLREASAHVLQAHNGREALEVARRKQPHVIVSDILMPKLDGFGLCRELKRDALLAHVPVILLSWKDDLLQRMRELDAGAAGYLRKEAGSQQILAQLAEVLQPRTQLIAKLRGFADVTGSLGQLGSFSLLELIAAERPDARLCVRDAWNLFEVDIRGGRRLSVTRTAADGAFTRGEKALMQLLGLGGGEFEVSGSTLPQRSTISEPLERALVATGRRLAALMDAVSDARLLRVCLIAFDDEVLQSLLNTPSTRLHEVVALFRTGHATAETVLREGRFAPGELEDYLRELARNAAITGVWDERGEDLVAAAQRERETPQLALLGASLAPRPGSGWSMPVESREADTMPVPREAVQVKASLAPAAEVIAPATKSSPAPAPDSLVLPAQATAAAEPLERVQADTDPDPTPPLAAGEGDLQTDPGLGPESRPPAVPAWLSPALGASATATSAALEATRSADSRSDKPKSPFLLDDPDSDAVSQLELESLDLPVPSTFARASHDRADWMRLAGTLVVLAGVGYFGWQQLVLTSEQAAPESATRVEAAKTPPATPQASPAPVPEPQPRPQSPPQQQPLPQPTIANTQFGKVLPYVDASRGVEVPPGQGLLVVELQRDTPAPTVRVGARELGKAPLAIALPAGRHELVVRSGKITSFRYLIVRPGETRIVSVPLAEL